MKKFISLKIFLLAIMTSFSTTLLSCRQDDENDFQTTQASVKKTDIKLKPESDDDNGGDNQTLTEVDPPIKNGTHWKQCD